MSRTKAQYIRQELINNLERCSSMNYLLELQKKFEASARFFVISPQFNNRHKKQLSQMDLRIEALFKEKRDEFSKEIDNFIQQLTLDDDELDFEDSASHSDDYEPECEDEQEPQDLYDLEFNLEDMDADADDEQNKESFSYVANSSHSSDNEEEELDDDKDLSSANGLPVKSIDKDRANDLGRVKAQLDLLYNKKLQFIKRQTQDSVRAVFAIESIHQKMTTYYLLYLQCDIDKATFQKEAKILLSDNNPDIKILQSHRGVKEILINIMAAIMMLGIGYAIAALLKRSLLVFKLPTDSNQKIESLKECIDEVGHTTHPTQA